MKPELLSHLSAALIDVLKTSAFAWGEPCATDELSTACDDVVLTRVQFDGDRCGSIRLALPGDLAAQLAADVLAAEADELSPEQVDDACKELTNVLCGQWLTRSYGTQPVFHLSVPEAIRRNDAAWGELTADPGAVGVQVDDEPLLACVEVR